jgi:hypothetical protein
MEKRYLSILIIAFTVIIGCTLATEARAIDKEAVKGAMKIYIDANTTGEEYMIEGEATAFDYIHSGVSETDGLFVSCADFKADNSTYDIDYYVELKDGKYNVVKEILHKVDGKKVNRLLKRGE